MSLTHGKKGSHPVPGDADSFHMPTLWRCGPAFGRLPLFCCYFGVSGSYSGDVVPDRLPQTADPEVAGAERGGDAPIKG